MGGARDERERDEAHDDRVVYVTEARVIRRDDDSTYTPRLAPRQVRLDSLHALILFMNHKTLRLLRLED